MRFRKHALPKLGFRKRLVELTAALTTRIEISFPVHSKKDFEYLRKLNQVANAKFK